MSDIKQKRIKAVRDILGDIYGTKGQRIQLPQMWQLYG